MIHADAVLTVWQPWASALVLGPKTVENRTWAPRRLQRGRSMLVAIHSAARPMRREDAEDVAGLWGRDGLAEAADRLFPGRSPVTFYDICPLGVVLGVVRFDGAFRADGSEDDDWIVGPWCWRVGERVPLSEPIPVVGRQGLWHPPPRVSKAVSRQLAGHARWTALKSDAGEV